jgi:DNA-binding CsgD family transcriptional regulator
MPPLRQLLPFAAAAILVAAGLTALDQGVEATSGGAALLLDFLDRLLLLGAAAGLAILVLRLTRLEDRAWLLEHDIRRAGEAAQDWRRRSRRLIDGLSEAVAEQFRAWGLTPAEADIAGLMLKGLPLADIAALRRTSEATIRQQAQSVYRKSGLASRAELAAYFLEDLFDTAERIGTTEPAAAPRELN